jgi:hypothetical protein
VYWRVRGDQSVVLEGPHHGLDVYRRKLRQRDPADVGDDVLAHDPAVAGLGAVLHRARQHVIEGSGDQRWLMLAQRQTGLEVVCGYGEHESSDGLAVELAVEVADVAGHLDDADAGGVGDRAVQSVEEGSRRVALASRRGAARSSGSRCPSWRRARPGRRVRSRQRRQGGWFLRRGSAHELVKQPIGDDDGDGQVGLSFSCCGSELIDARVQAPRSRKMSVVAWVGSTGRRSLVRAASSPAEAHNSANRHRQPESPRPPRPEAGRAGTDLPSPRHSPPGAPQAGSGQSDHHSRQPRGGKVAALSVDQAVGWARTSGTSVNRSVLA